MKRNLLLVTILFVSYLSSYSQCACSTPTFIASAQGTGNSTGVTVPKPTGVVQGHLMIAAIHVGWCNSGSAITPPAGWTLINSTSNTGSGCGSSNTSIQLATFYKVAGAAEPANYAFTATSNQFYVGGIVAYSGANTVTPIMASSNNGAQDLCASIVASGVTTTVSCTRLVGVFFCSVNSSLNNIIPQGSMTERVDVGTTGNHPWGNENLEIADEAFSTMGATGNRTAGLSGCSSNGWVTGAQLIAIMPANAGSSPVISVNSGSICPGGTFTMNPNGATSYTFQGGNAVVSPTATVSYTVQGSVGSCLSNVVSSTVNVEPAPSINANTSNSLICGPPFQQTATLTANGASTYTWNTSATGSTTAVSPSVTTSYTVTGTAANGCTNTAVITQSVSTCAGVMSSGVETLAFSIYPNPNNGTFVMELPLEVRVEIVNALGQTISTENKLPGTHSIDISKYNNGIYLIRLSGQQKTAVYRIVKQ